MSCKYPVSRQTREAIEPRVKAVAAAADLSTSYLYAVLAGEKSDPFAAFLRLFEGAADADPAAVDPWLDHLCAAQEAARARARRRGPKGAAAGGEPPLAALHRELSDVIAAALGGRAAAEQLREIDEALVELAARRDALCGRAPAAAAANYEN